MISQIVSTLKQGHILGFNPGALDSQVCQVVRATLSREKNTRKATRSHIQPGGLGIIHVGPGSWVVSRHSPFTWEAHMSQMWDQLCHVAGDHFEHQ